MTTGEKISLNSSVANVSAMDHLNNIIVGTGGATINVPTFGSITSTTASASSELDIIIVQDSGIISAPSSQVEFIQSTGCASK